MRQILVGRSLIAGALCLLVASCGDSQSSQVDIFQSGTSTLRGKAFGLHEKQIALTLDDGPSKYSAGLARYLEHRNVPATFFVNFDNGSNGINTEFGRATVRAACHSKLHRVGNHSDNHSFSKRDWPQFEKVHDFLTKNCPQDWFFLRSPGGNWKPTDAQSLNATQDSEGRALRTTYVGPVYWDFGGDEPRADWHPDCQKNPTWCRNSYRDEIVASNGGGIVLTHDIYPSTMEMLVGKNWKALLDDPTAEDPGDGLISEMEKRGYRWVSLTDNRDLLVSLLGRDPVPLTF